MSQNKPGCLQALIGLAVAVAIPMFMCGGCLVGGGAIVHQANVSNARIEAAKSPQQKAKEKAAKEDDDMRSELRYMGELLMKKSLNYPQNSKMPRYGKVSKLGENEYSVTGIVDASNAFGVRQRKKWVVVFSRESKAHQWTHGEVGFWDGE